METIKLDIKDTLKFISKDALSSYETKEICIPNDYPFLDERDQNQLLSSSNHSLNPLPHIHIYNTRMEPLINLIYDFFPLSIINKIYTYKYRKSLFTSHIIYKLATTKTFLNTYEISNIKHINLSQNYKNPSFYPREHQNILLSNCALKKNKYLYHLNLT